MSARCPLCDRIVPIRVVRVEWNGRFVYQPHAHDDGDRLCMGKEIR